MHVSQVHSRPCGQASTSQRGAVRCSALFGRNSAADRALVKAQLLSAIEPLYRGATASEADQAYVDKMAQAVEALNPNPDSLAAPEINGKWRLVYTTSASILGLNRPPPLRPSGPIYQTIDGVNYCVKNIKECADAYNLRARNNESAPFFSSVTAELEPMSTSKVFVRFKKFKIGNVVPINAPDTATGELDTTYVDSELRISRGDQGNLFILLMDDPNARLGTEF